MAELVILNERNKSLLEAIIEEEIEEELASILNPLQGSNFVRKVNTSSEIEDSYDNSAFPQFKPIEKPVEKQLTE